jgi:hypothetical protein
VLSVAKRPVWQAVYALTGQRIQAPTRYFELGIYGGYFEADASSVQARLPPGFEVIQHRAGSTELGLWCAEYRRIDGLRPYNELAVLVPVEFAREGMPPLTASFVLSMLVTSDEARFAGVEIYGFPKSLAEISIVDEDAHTRGEVRQRGVDVLTLRVESRLTKPFEDPATLLNVRRDGHVIECLFEISGDRSIDSRSGSVVLELGHHAIADELREIGLRTGSGRGLYAPHAAAVLGIGVDLGPLPPRPLSPTAQTKSTLRACVSGPRITSSTSSGMRVGACRSSTQASSVQPSATSSAPRSSR